MHDKAHIDKFKAMNAVGRRWVCTDLCVQLCFHASMLQLWRSVLTQLLLVFWPLNLAELDFISQPFFMVTNCIHKKRSNYVVPHFWLSDASISTFSTLRLRRNRLDFRVFLSLGMTLSNLHSTFYYSVPINNMCEHSVAHSQCVPLLVVVALQIHVLVWQFVCGLDTATEGQPTLYTCTGAGGD